MAGMAFSEEIKFYTQTLVSDGQGGKTSSGETLSLTTLAEVKEKTLRWINDGQFTFTKGLQAIIWKNPSFTPVENSLVEWKGSRYTIQAVNEDDTHNKYILTLIART